MDGKRRRSFMRKRIKILRQLNGRNPIRSKLTVRHPKDRAAKLSILLGEMVGVLTGVLICPAVGGSFSSLFQFFMQIPVDAPAPSAFTPALDFATGEVAEWSKATLC